MHDVLDKSVSKNLPILKSNYRLSAVPIRGLDSLVSVLELSNFQFYMEDHIVVNDQEALEKEEQ